MTNKQYIIGSLTSMIAAFSLLLFINDFKTAGVALYMVSYVFLIVFINSFKEPYDIPRKKPERAYINGHPILTTAEVMSREVVIPDRMYDHVVNGGLSICKRCGRAESELNEPCISRV